MSRAAEMMGMELREMREYSKTWELIHTSSPFITEAVLRQFVQRIRPSEQ